MNKSIAMINNVSERYRPDCYRGLGELVGRIFRDVSYSAPFLNNIPPEYQCAAFEGLARSEEHTSELQSQFHLVCRLLLVKLSDQDTVPGCFLHGMDANQSSILQTYQ